jgi:hypothetical protein
MTCSEFQQQLPDLLDGGLNGLQPHLHECPACASLVADLRSISQQAASLRAADEPSPRVWNSLEIELRREGLIRSQPVPQPAANYLPSFARRWGVAGWLVPVAAMVLAAAFFVTNPLHRPRVIVVSHPEAPISDDDQRWLSAVQAQAPLMTAAYKTDLDDVNDYIRDAEAMAKQYPNNEEAQRALRDAYEQKSMLYDLALNHSLR